jgi:glycosyltransferase involved in cell wall biosynthesis
MANPFFSIIIPALNEAKYLPNLLTDLAQQTYQDFEVIIVDGDSDDATVAKAKTFKSKLPSLTILTSPKRHVCTQRNLGAKAAKADVLIFCDADNRLPSYFLQGIKYRWESDPTDLATTWVMPDKNKPLDDTIAKALNYAMELAKKSSSSFFAESMTICRRTSFKHIQGFNELINYGESRQISQDILKAGYQFKIYRDPTYTYSFRRIRKYGALILAAKMAQHQLSTLLDIPLSPRQLREFYPMKGGTFFDKPYHRKQRFIKNIAKILKDF